MKREQTGVEFTDSEGTKYVLKLSTNQFIAAQKMVEDLKGREYQRYIFYLCLVNGAESQKTITVEEAGEILDDIGFFKASELSNQTRFFKNVNQSNAADEAKREAEKKKKDAEKKDAAPQGPVLH